MIELEGVTKSYDGRTVVADVSFTVERGELCVVLGSSGAGKSTLLRMINRLIPMSSGTIRIGGQDITGIPAETLRRRIGYAIQSIGLFPHWTIEDNIATVPRLLKWEPSRIRNRVDELMALVRLDGAEYRRKYPHQLSGGQQQRAGIARALAADPEILLMDEAFGALDPVTREALRGELARIHRATGKTILFVTHDIDLALVLADRLAIMRDGGLVQYGVPLAILEHPADDFVADFIGRSELGLKLLSLRRVGDHLRPGETVGGEPIAPDASLKEALSEMIRRRTDRLPVGDGKGGVTGSLRLADLVA